MDKKEKILGLIAEILVLIFLSRMLIMDIFEALAVSFHSFWMIILSSLFLAFGLLLVIWRIAKVIRAC